MVKGLLFLRLYVMLLRSETRKHTEGEQGSTPMGVQVISLAAGDKFAQIISLVTGDKWRNLYGN